MGPREIIERRSLEAHEARQWRRGCEISSGLLLREHWHWGQQAVFVMFVFRLHNAIHERTTKKQRANSKRTVDSSRGVEANCKAWVEARRRCASEWTKLSNADVAPTTGLHGWAGGNEQPNEGQGSWTSNQVNILRTIAPELVVLTYCVLLQELTIKELTRTAPHRSTCALVSVCGNVF